MVCADHFRVGFLATAIYVGPQRAFSRHLGIYRSDVNLFSTWTRAASRQPRLQVRTTRREDHVILIVPMSSGRLFLGRLLASIACLRFTGTINLPCPFRMATPNRTFLLCQQ
jgi:hypothetical protein